MGQHRALLEGIRAARHPVTVTLDDDGEQPPEAILQLVDKLLEGHDAVFAIASRRPRAPWRNLATRLSNSLFVGLNAHGVPPAPLRAFRTELREGFLPSASPFLSLDVLLNWTISRPAVIEEPYETTPGGSRLGLARLWDALTEGMTGLGLWPLRLATLIGALCLFVGAGLLLTAMGLWVTGRDPGSALWLAAGGCVAFGTQCMLLGILGEYVGRVRFQMMLGSPPVKASQSR